MSSETTGTNVSIQSSFSHSCQKTLPKQSVPYRPSHCPRKPCLLPCSPRTSKSRVYKTFQIRPKTRLVSGAVLALNTGADTDCRRKLLTEGGRSQTEWKRSRTKPSNSKRAFLLLTTQQRLLFWLRLLTSPSVTNLYHLLRHRQSRSTKQLHPVYS